MNPENLLALFGPEALANIARAMSTGTDPGRSRLPVGPPTSARGGAREELMRPGDLPMQEYWAWRSQRTKPDEDVLGGWIPNRRVHDPNPPGEPEITIAEVPLTPGDLASLAKLLSTLGRAHPKYIAAKKWFHGGSEGLEAQDIDPLGGRRVSLKRKDFYMTDEPPIARGYAKGARKKARRRGLRDAGSATYEAELSVDRVLDLEKPITDDVAEIFRNRAKWVYDEDSGIVSEAVEKALAKEGATGESVFQAFKSGISDASNDLMISTNEYVVDFQELAIALREAGYDALTHTGGLRTGSDPHQVMIMLDPNDAFSLVGRGDQIRHFKPTAHE